MVHKVVLFALALCFWATSSALADADAEDRKAEYDRLLGQLTSANVKARAQTWTSLRARPDRTITVLMQIGGADVPSGLLAHLRPSVIRGLRRNAIEALGEFRARDASGFLVRHMAEKFPLGYVTEFTPYLAYPAAQAILNVGEPAIQSMLGWLGDAYSDEHLKLIAYILWHYYAPQGEQDVGLFRLQRRLERELREQAESAQRTGKTRAPSVREKNLRTLIETYKTIRPNDPTDWPKP